MIHLHLLILRVSKSKEFFCCIQDQNYNLWPKNIKNGLSAVYDDEDKTTIARTRNVFASSAPSSRSVWNKYGMILRYFCINRIVRLYLKTSYRILWLTRVHFPLFISCWWSQGCSWNHLCFFPSFLLLFFRIFFDSIEFFILGFLRFS